MNEGPWQLQEWGVDAGDFMDAMAKLASDDRRRLAMRHRIEGVIERFTSEEPTWSPHNPNTVKDLARLIRDEVMNLDDPKDAVPQMTRGLPPS